MISLTHTLATGYIDESKLGELDILVITLLTIVILVAIVWKMMRPSPPLYKQYATKSEVSEVKDEVMEVKADVGELKSDMDNRFKEASVAGSLSRDKLYGSIRDLEKSMAAQLASDRAIHGILHEIREDNRGTQERLSTLMTEVGKLHGKVHHP